MTNMKAQHTPFPKLFVYEDSKPDEYFVGNDDDNGQFSLADGLNHEQALFLANAVNCHAELLEALEMLHQQFWQSDKDYRITNTGGKGEVFSKARAAIAKATGAV